MDLKDFILSLYCEETVLKFSSLFNTINFTRIAEKLEDTILHSDSIQKRNGYIAMIGKNTKYPLYF